MTLLFMVLGDQEKENTYDAIVVGTWITTVVNVSFGEGDSETNLQRVLDAQIVDGKIKKVYGYERVISKEEN